MLDDTQAALRRVQERYLRPRDANDGVYVRLWECSLPCIGGSCATCNTVQRCVLHELNQTQVIGSLLRWDLPAAVFANGQCAHPQGSQNVTASGIGWIFGDLTEPDLRQMRRGMFAHDAGVMRQLGPKRQRKHECASTSIANVSAAYATARFDVVQRGLGLRQSEADDEYLGFLHSASNCYHRSWHDAAAFQRAFALLLARRRNGTVPARHRQCHWLRGGLYNQAHAVIRNATRARQVLEAIFYVNATTVVASSGRDAGRRVALRVSARAFETALSAQKSVARRIGKVLPILQYRASAECFDSRPLALRLRLAQRAGEGPRERWAHSVFAAPPRRHRAWADF